MQKSRQSNDYPDYFQSKIEVSPAGSLRDIKIKPESIKIIHKDKNGKVIPYIKKDNNLNKCEKEEYFWCYYRQIYSDNELPRKILENVYLEILVGDEIKKIEYEFLLEYRLHYTWWDKIMGI